MIEAYPLCWPSDYLRSQRRKNSRFKTTLGAARDYVKAEITRMDGKNPIISTNIPLKQDGDLRADWTRYKIDDPGVAVYFDHNGKQVCLCCDSYERVWENLYAIGRSIEALRQIARDGVSDFLNRTFTGFKALAEHSSAAGWHEVLDLPANASQEDIRKAYLRLAAIHHPDNGGSAEVFDTINKAYRQANNPH